MLYLAPTEPREVSTVSLACRRRALTRRVAALALAAPLALTVACGRDDATPTPTATPTAALPTETAEPTPTAAWPQLGTARITTDDLNVRVGPGPEYLVLGRLQPGDEVPVAGRASNGRWLALPGIGWITYDETWQELQGVAWDDLPLVPVDQAGFEFVGPLHPLDVAVDIPVVDVVVNAVVQNDRTALRGLVAVEEPGGATEATATGTPAAASPPRHFCSDDIYPASELPDRLDEFLASSTGAEGPLHLYAVIGQPGESGEDGRDPEFSIVFAFEGGEGRQVWVDSRGAGITWFSLGCGGLAPGDLLRLDRGGELFFWVRPVVPDPLDPVE